MAAPRVPGRSAIEPQRVGIGSSIARAAAAPPSATYVPHMASREDITRYRRNWQDEIDSAWQYRAMADGEPNAATAQVYRDLAAIEEKHARFWEKQLAKAGASAGPAQPSWRARVLSWFARRMGARVVLPTVAAREYADRDGYATQPETRSTRMT